MGDNYRGSGLVTAKTNPPVNISEFSKCLKRDVWQRLKIDGYDTHLMITVRTGCIITLALLSNINLNQSLWSNVISF